MVNILQTIGVQLSAMGYRSIDQDAILSKVIHELKGPRFDSFVESWDVLPDSEKTIETLVQKLKIHESRHDLWKKEEEVVQEKAFSGVKPGGVFKKNYQKKHSDQTNPATSGKKSGKCFRCGKRVISRSTAPFPLKRKRQDRNKRKRSLKSLMKINLQQVKLRKLTC